MAKSNDDEMMGDEESKPSSKSKVKKENQGDAEQAPTGDEVESAEDGESPTGAGVTVSEEFQKKAHHMTKNASKHELNHLRDKISDRESALMKEKADKESPEGFSSDSMPPID